MQQGAGSTLSFSFPTSSSVLWLSSLPEDDHWEETSDMQLSRWRSLVPFWLIKSSKDGKGERSKEEMTKDLSCTIIWIEKEDLRKEWDTETELLRVRKKWECHLLFKRNHITASVQHGRSSCLWLHFQLQWLPRRSGQSGGNCGGTGRSPPAMIHLLHPGHLVLGVPPPGDASQSHGRGSAPEGDPPSGGFSTLSSYR